MTRLRVLMARVIALFQRRRLDEALDDEIRTHLDHLAEEHRTRGLSPEAARDAARKDFGGVEQLRERYRDERRLPLIDTLTQDVGYAGRTFRRTPSFTIVSILTLALGIGATTTTFSILNAVVFQELPYQDASQLASIAVAAKDGTEFVSYPTFTDWQEQSRTFASMAAYVMAGSTVTGQGDAVLLEGAAVTTNLFGVLHAAPIVGRPLMSEDGLAGAHRVVVISEQLWNGQFARTRDIIGRSITLDGMPYTIVGVMAQGFTFPHLNPVPQFWMPLTQYRPFEQLLTIRAAPFLSVIGRLRTGSDVSQAQEDMRAIGLRLAGAHPADDRGETIEVLPFQQKLVGNNRLALLMLFGAVGCLLLIACINVANLQLARGATRVREAAVRVALGATRRQLVRQLLVESLVLAFAGGMLGWLMAHGGIQWLGALIREDLPRIRDIGLDRQVLGFSLALSGLAGVLAGIIPALVSTRVAAQQQLKEGGPSGTKSRRYARVQNALVVSQVALTLVMLTVAGLLVRTLLNFQDIDPGFRSTQVVAATISLPQSAYTRPEQWIAVNEELLGRVEHIAGVDAAAYGVGVPFTTPPVHLPFDLDGPASADAGVRTTTDMLSISPNYFSVLGIPVLRGRVFAASEPARVGIINQTFARRFFGEDDPIGKTILFGQPRRTVEIVGIVGDTSQTSLVAPSPPLLYLPFRRSPFWFTTLIVRTTIDPDALMNTIRREVAAAAPGAPVWEMGPLAMFVDRTFAASGRRAFLVASVGVLALLLATVGIYGVLTYAVASRTQEIGLRMALGADSRGVVRLVLGQGFRLALAGIALGLLLSLAMTRVLESLLFGVGTTDPVTFTTVGILLAFVTLLACWLPARRALRVDPIVAMRYE